MSGDGKLNFFISRAGEDAEWAVWIAEVLKEAGHDYFIQDHQVQFGNNFVVEMREAMERCNHVISVLTPDYLNKDFTMSEMDTAYRLDPRGDKRMLLIVRVKPCDPPRLYSHFVYLDLRQRNAQAKRMLIARINGERPVREGEHRTFIAKLPTVDPTLIGREEQLEFLDRAWSDPETNVVQIIAAGGTGKTALADKWFRRHLKEATIFGWSFYSQGTSENRQTSSDPFFTEILSFFGITIPPEASVYAKAEAVARRLRQEQVLLILDGIEPLQETSGGLRDQALKALLHELGAHNKGLALCTTRLRIADVPDDAPRALSIDLDNLDPEHGAEYLRRLGVKGTDDELRKASADYDNHALALTLLGTYLVDFCEADVRRRVEIPKLMVGDMEGAAHARRVMEGYARMFAGKPELDIVRALGYFDRPAEPAAIKLVLPAMSDRAYRAALNRLYQARLILSADPADDLDCHPLIREHFADVVRSDAPDEFRAGHSRLYEHYCKQAPEQPATLEAMTPLFHAVYHGCQASRYEEACRNVYQDRIFRGNRYYLLHVLGAFGSNLSLLANFFESPWTGPVTALSPVDQSWIINNSAHTLRGLGRLADAVAPMRASAEAGVKLEDWRNAAIVYNNLSQLQLAIGKVNEAIATARRAVDLADRSGHTFQRMVNHATLADALHQLGNLTESARLFEEAERLQIENQPEYAILYTIPGYQYCDLLLSRGQTAEVLRRGTQTLPWEEEENWLLNIGLDHLSLGRAHPPGSAGSAVHLDQAVDFLRRAGTLHHLPRALLARGTQHDLDEVYTIATRSGMRLFLADYHLAQARLDLREGRTEKARGHVDQAAALIEQTGYHRRDAELTELRSAIIASGV